MIKKFMITALNFIQLYFATLLIISIILKQVPLASKRKTVKQCNDIVENYMPGPEF